MRREAIYCDGEELRGEGNAQECIDTNGQRKKDFMNTKKGISWKTYGELRKRDFEIADLLPNVADRITEEKARRMGLTLRQYKAAETEGVDPKILAAYIRHMTKCGKKENEDA